MQRLLKEPFVHFVVLGGLLFAAHSVWTKLDRRAEYTITVSAAEIQRQAEIFATENQRPATEEDIRALLFAHIEEEVLMREALRLGLDQNDTIIRRRLAQKMRFLIEDVSPETSADEATLQTWYTENIARFQIPERRRFTHVYFSPQNHADPIAAARAAATLITTDNAAALGDPFIQGQNQNLQSLEDIRRDFGPTFANCVFSLDVATWDNPCTSAYGAHLVYVSEIKPAQTPAFDVVQDEVKRDWVQSKQRTANQAQLAAIMEKYTVDVEDIAP